MPNVSRATRAEMMLELSPLDTAANASASSMPASTSVSRSKPTPVTVRPAKSGPSRRKASALWSTTATECPAASRLCAIVDPTRPHPMITTCTDGHDTRASLPYPRLRVLARRHLQAAGRRAPDAQRAARRAAAAEEDRIAGLRERRIVLGRVRDRGDPARP